VAITNKIIPNLGYEIEDDKYHTWQITNWRSLGYRTIGPEFEAGGWKWRILLFPFGNNNPDVVSIYLEFADAAKVPSGWCCYLQLALILWNPEEPTQYVGYYTRHRYTTDSESDWGFTRFYPQRKLFASSSSRTRLLIENNRCNITVFVRISKEPIDSQLDNFVEYFTSNPPRGNRLKFYNYDSKKETGYISLKDNRTSSFINSLLLSLYFINYFRKENDGSIENVSLALQSLFYQMQNSNTSIETTNMTKSMGWYSFGSFIQHDAQEFNRMLQDILEKKMKVKLMDHNSN
ncbi:11520_t:CDS:2, partial [Scutellospora calospora]